MVTIDKYQAPQPGLKVDALTHINVSKFTQSELHSLSLCSSAAFNLNNTDDLVIPNIDPSVFNESAGKIVSRSRSSAPGSRRRCMSKRSPSDHHHHRAEDNCIVNFLKQLIGENQDGCRDQNSVSVTDNSKQIVVYDQGKSKRKGRNKDKGGEIDQWVEFEVLNVNGVAVDFEVLGTADDLYGAELLRRTAGSETEEDGLGFFRGLEGEWCSRRKKRRIVDASMIGNWMPVGWKLVLALRRRDGRFSVYCRTYLRPEMPFSSYFVSPSGHQFPSCKDVAHYLQSHYGFSDLNLPIDQGPDGVQHASNMESESQHASSIHKPGDIKHDNISNSPMPSSLLSEAHGNELILLDIDNLPEVQVSDTFECRNCDMTFGEKEAYIQHLMSFHRKTTRRFRLGSSVGKGVIIKDGKFECQFCHKVFLEKYRYNCHVGIHVRTNVRKSQELRGHGTVQKSVQSPTENAEPSRTAKLDALLQIAENSFLETSNVEHDDKHDGGSSPDQRNNGCNPVHATVGGQICDAQQHIDSVTNSEEPRHDEARLVEGKLFQSLSDISKESNAIMEEGPNSFVSLEPKAVRVDMASIQQLTSVCVWCRSEFYHEAIGLEGLSDSIGFMCPTCKAKISGHLDNGLSINSHCF